MFTALAAYLASAAAAATEAAAAAGSAILEGAEVAGSAIMEGAKTVGSAALEGAEAVGDVAAEGAKAAGKEISALGKAAGDSANAALNRLPEGVSSNIKTGAKELAAGFKDPQSDLIISDADGSVAWGKTLARAAGAGGRNYTAGIAKKVLEGNGNASNTRKIMGKAAGSLI